MNELLTAKQVQDILNIDRTTVYRMLKDGRLSGIKIGKHWRFLNDEIQKLLNPGQQFKPQSDPANVTIFPIHCIQSLQDVFGEITNLGSLTIDSSGKPITTISNSCSFCKLIQSSPDGMQACQDSWKQITVRNFDSDSFFTCHAGLSYTSAHIKVGSAGEAFLIAGQFFPSNSKKEEHAQKIERLAEKYSLKKDDLSRAQQQTSVLDERIRQNLKNWMARIARTIVSISLERSTLLNRMKKISEISSMDLETLNL